MEESDDLIDGIHRYPSGPHSRCPAMYRRAVLELGWTRSLRMPARTAASAAALRPTLIIIECVYNSVSIIPSYR